jgi:hypothetical protein
MVCRKGSKATGFDRIGRLVLLLAGCAVVGELAFARVGIIRPNAPAKYGPGGPQALPPAQPIPEEDRAREDPQFAGTAESDVLSRGRWVQSPAILDEAQSNTPSRGLNPEGSSSLAPQIPSSRILAQNSQKSNPSASKSGLNKDRFKKPKAVEPIETLELPQTPIEILTFNQKQARSICFRYEGKIVAYYSDVFKIENCKRRHIVDSKTVYDLVSKGQKVIDVEREVMVALPEGEPFDVPRIVVNPQELCRRLSNQYITYSYVDVYFVEGCKRRLFPDWTTYTTHRSKRGGDPKGVIESLPIEEFAAIPEGDPIPSVVDEMFSKLLSGEAGIDVIPIDEACKGLERQTVSFYSRLYKIEKCRKREMIGMDSIFKVGEHEQGKIQELTAEKWLSLPDGEPLTIKGADRYNQSKGPPRSLKNSN